MALAVLTKDDSGDSRHLGTVEQEFSSFATVVADTP